ncbi:hypothetical protein [Salinispora cortesiana]|uniref:hypothetical protein n=1 Tax=Salinispora cortesiana TaxID=1305843 RepID=UPI0004700710
MSPASKVADHGPRRPDLRAAADTVRTRPRARRLPAAQDQPTVILDARPLMTRLAQQRACLR